jgi:hypothetical protein
MVERRSGFLSEGSEVSQGTIARLQGFSCCWRIPLQSISSAPKRVDGRFSCLAGTTFGPKEKLYARESRMCLGKAPQHLRKVLSNCRTSIRCGRGFPETYLRLKRAGHEVVGCSDHSAAKLLLPIVLDLETCREEASEDAANRACAERDKNGCPRWKHRTTGRLVVCTATRLASGTLIHSPLAE